MIHDEICTYEVCKLAKEKGFPQDVFGTCEMKSSCYLEDGRFYKDGCIYPIENAYTAHNKAAVGKHIIIGTDTTTIVKYNTSYGFYVTE